MTTLEKLFNNNPAWLLNNDRVDAFAVGVVGLSSYDFRLFLVLAWSELLFILCLMLRTHAALWMINR